jgi:hypothetical protein
MNATGAGLGPGTVRTVLPVEAWRLVEQGIVSHVVPRDQLESLAAI